jgi:hypothetical protein
VYNQNALPGPTRPARPLGWQKRENTKGDTVNKDAPTRDTSHTHGNNNERGHPSSGVMPDADADAPVCSIFDAHVI